MIRAVSWFCADDCGVHAPEESSFEQKSPDFSGTAEIPALVGRPVKYYARMTPQTRCCLFAASLAMNYVGWEGDRMEIGLVAAGSEGCLRANGEYFRDYVANGRTLGRGNLFIYTLPTSALGEVAIALSLTGPSFFIQQSVKPVKAFVRIGNRMIADGEARGMLGLWSDSEAAICFVIEEGENSNDANVIAGGESSPREMCRAIRELARRP
jgi:3-oxoacyl-(acyl-carrier-protein) synthase